MYNPGEDSLHAPNPSPYDNPTAEVGSAPFVTMDQLMAIVSQINQQREHSVSVEPNELTLLRFIPEIAYADPVVWCSTVSLFMERRPIQSDELFFTLSRVLEDTASH
jgi:hypothetical protein